MLRLRLIGMTRSLLVLPAICLVLAACATDVPQRASEPPSAGTPLVQSPAGADTRTGPLGDDSTSSCVERYTPAAVAARAFAFDGTVTHIGPGTTNKPGQGQLETAAVTFEVHEWWRGGSGGTVTIDMSPPTSGSRSDSEEPPAYDVGTRLLVSGEARWGGAPLDKPLAWGCGFTRYFDDATAADWRRATR